MTGLPIGLGARRPSRRASAPVIPGDDAAAHVARLRRRVATVAASGGFLVGLAAIAAALGLSTYL